MSDGKNVLTQYSVFNTMPALGIEPGEEHHLTQPIHGEPFRTYEEADRYRKQVDKQRAEMHIDMGTRIRTRSVYLGEWMETEDPS